MIRVAIINLGQIREKSNKVIDSLVNIIKNTDLPPQLSIEAANVLNKIDYTNKTAIDTLVHIIQCTTVISKDRASNLENEYNHFKATIVLAKIDSSNKTAINAALRLIQSAYWEFLDDEFIIFLNHIGQHNPTVINALTNMILEEKLDLTSHTNAIDILGNIAVGNQKAIKTLLMLIDKYLANPKERNTGTHIGMPLNMFRDKVTYSSFRKDNQHDFWKQKSDLLLVALNSLCLIAVGNQLAIDTLVNIIRDSTIDNKVREQMAKILKKIAEKWKYSEFYEVFKNNVSA